MFIMGVNKPNKYIKHVIIVGITNSDMKIWEKRWRKKKLLYIFKSRIVNSQIYNSIFFSVAVVKEMKGISMHFTDWIA